jgi:hypothetical protein
MAAFLKELKDVKLRRVGSANSVNRSGGNSFSSQELNIEDLSLIGQKRKTIGGGEIQGSLGVLLLFVKFTPFDGPISSIFIETTIY